MSLTRGPNTNYVDNMGREKPIQFGFNYDKTFVWYISYGNWISWDDEKIALINFANKEWNELDNRGL